jgi:hypothetical protein
MHEYVAVVRGHYEVRFFRPGACFGSNAPWRYCKPRRSLAIFNATAFESTVDGTNRSGATPDVSQLPWLIGLIERPSGT